MSVASVTNIRYAPRYNCLHNVYTVFTVLHCSGHDTFVLNSIGIYKTNLPSNILGECNLVRSLISCDVCDENKWCWCWERLLTYDDNYYNNDEDNIGRELGEPFPGSFLRYRMGRGGQSVSVTTSNTAFLNNALGKIFIKKKRNACQRFDRQKTLLICGKVLIWIHKISTNAFKQRKIDHSDVERVMSGYELCWPPSVKVLNLTLETFQMQLRTVLT